jgi:hypothetical protein
MSQASTFFTTSFAQKGYLQMLARLFDKINFWFWIYWTYAPVVFADNNNDNNTAKVTFYEDGTGVITNGTSLRVQFDYNFTEGAEEGEEEGGGERY